MFACKRMRRPQRNVGEAKNFPKRSMHAALPAFPLFAALKWKCDLNWESKLVYSVVKLA